jgi:hypothetical protein
MTALLDRLRGWLGGLVSRSERDESAAPGADDAAGVDPTGSDEASAADGTTGGEATSVDRDPAPVGGDGAASPRGSTAGIETGEPGAGSRPGADSAYRCAVCGTGVDDPDADCPLCRSSDVRPAADVDAGAVDESPAGLDPERVRTARVRDGDDPADRLRRLRESGGGGSDSGDGN